METIELNINNISNSDKKFYLSNYGVEISKSNGKLKISSSDRKNINKVVGYIREKDFSIKKQKEDSLVESKEGSISYFLLDNNNKKSSRNKGMISQYETSYFSF